MGHGHQAMLFYPLAVIGACLAKPVFLGVAATLKWFASMSGSQRFEKSIDDYNKLHEDTVDARNDSYAQLVNQYYDLATEFYEWGWGQSFHFADRRKGETFATSILRHETYLAGRLGVNKGAKLLDCGCGVGGPARNISSFTGAHVTGITINQFQVDRGNTLSQQQGMSKKVKLVQG